MAQFLNELVTYQFQTDDALIFSEQTLPQYRIAAGTNEFLNTYIVDAESLRAQLLGQINTGRASNLTPEIHKWDDARTTEEASLEQYLRSLTQQYVKTDTVALQVKSADRLLQVIGQKCPDFRIANDNLQTVYIDALKTEFSKDEYQPAIQSTGIAEKLANLYSYNDSFKQLTDQRKNEKAPETPQVRAIRSKLMEKLSQFHSNLKQLIEKNPGTYDDVVLQVNATNSAIMARIRARLTREQNAKGTTDAIVVEPETAVAP